MNKYNRQRLILDLVNEREVRTQDELSNLLKAEGVDATQATISRDIKELRISKIRTAAGDYKYVALDTDRDSMAERMQKILASATLSVTHNKNMIIIETVAYCASICGMAITNAKLSNIAGIVTGHDTIFIAVKDFDRIDETVGEIKELLSR